MQEMKNKKLQGSNRQEWFSKQLIRIEVILKIVTVHHEAVVKM